MEEKPPLGLVPQSIFKDDIKKIKKEVKVKIGQLKIERIHDIINAMQRYSESKKVIPIEWVEELNTILFIPEWLDNLFDFSGGID